jgi:ABC-2 type transport system permease protein
MVSRNKKIHRNGLMNIKKYIKIYSLFLYTSIASELEYKTNVIIDFITAILSLVGSLELQ